MSTVAPTVTVNASSGLTPGQILMQFQRFQRMRRQQAKAVPARNAKWPEKK